MDLGIEEYYNEVLSDKSDDFNVYHKEKHWYLVKIDTTYRKFEYGIEAHSLKEAVLESLNFIYEVRGDYPKDMKILYSSVLY